MNCSRGHHYRVGPYAQAAAHRLAAPIENRRLHAYGAAMLDEHPLGSTTRENAGAVRRGERKIRQVHRLLRIARAPEGAKPAAVAVLDVAADGLAVQSQRLHPAVEYLGVLTDQG